MARRPTRSSRTSGDESRSVARGSGRFRSGVIRMIVRLRSSPTRRDPTQSCLGRGKNALATLTVQRYVRRCAMVAGVEMNERDELLTPADVARMLSFNVKTVTV